MADTQQVNMSYQQGMNTLFSTMFTFRHSVVVGDFTQTSISFDTKIQYTQATKGSKTTSSTAPRGFDTIDDWIDFCAYIDAGTFRKAIGLYFRLRRYLGI